MAIGIMRLVTAAFAASLALSVAQTQALAQSQADGQETVDHSLGTLRDLRGDKEFGNARQLIQRARAVLIAPRIFKAGFFIGGEGGQALLMTRDAHGWSDPAFYTVASASFGLQIGAQQSEMVMIIMTDRALRALMQDHFKIGANAGLAIATLGSTVEGATTSAVGADVVVWASASGAYAGISLDGTVIEPRQEENTAYYGRQISVADIVLRRDVRNPRASGLVRTMDQL